MPFNVNAESAVLRVLQLAALCDVESIAIVDAHSTRDILHAV